LKIYDLNPLSYKDYIEHTKNGKDCTIFVAKRKFSAMIEATPYMENIDPERKMKIYHIGKFCIVAVDGIKPYIPFVFWGEKVYSLNSEQQTKLKDKYSQYGLTQDGNFLNT
jgi:hypothetical protein